MTPILSSLEGMAAMYMASQQGPHTAQSIRDIIGQLRNTPMFTGKVEDHDAEELARLIEEKYGISMGLGAVVDAKDFRPWLHDARINGEVGDFYWSRYRKLLNLKGLPKSVIDATDEGGYLRGEMAEFADRLGVGLDRIEADYSNIL